jgi:hypothetical protein
MTDDLKRIEVAITKLDGKTELIANDVKHIREGIEERTARIKSVEDRADATDKKIYIFSGVATAIIMFSDKLKNLVLGQ